MRLVVALGGNALLRRGQAMTAENQRANVAVAARSLAPVAQAHKLVVTHGNGPQVGLIALQGLAYDKVAPYPLDVLGAESEGMIGYMIEQEMGNLLPFEVPLATLLTQVEVDGDDVVDRVAPLGEGGAAEAGVRRRDHPVARGCEPIEDGAVRVESADAVQEEEGRALAALVQLELVDVAYGSEISGHEW